MASCLLLCASRLSSVRLDCLDDESVLFLPWRVKVPGLLMLLQACQWSD